MASIFIEPVASAVAWPWLLILATAWLVVFHHVTAFPWASGNVPVEPSE
jgi:hypothetical protein